MPELLEIISVSKIYPVGKVDAVRDVTASIHKGEFVSLLGPSGCGKSTLLNLVGAMDKPSTGDIILDGTSLSGLSDDRLTDIRRMKVGFVFQFFNLLANLTVKENVSIPLELASINSAEIKQRVNEILNYLGIAHRGDSYPSQLSGGEMQRVAIARAAIHAPVLIVADEPTGNLDSENGDLVLDLLSRLNTENGTTIIMATHSREAASRSARVLSMRDGRLIDNGSTLLENNKQPDGDSSR